MGQESTWVIKIIPTIPGNSGGRSSRHPVNGNKCNGTRNKYNTNVKVIHQSPCIVCTPNASATNHNNAVINVIIRIPTSVGSIPGIGKKHHRQAAHVIVINVPAPIQGNVEHHHQQGRRYVATSSYRHHRGISSSLYHQYHIIMYISTTTVRVAVIIISPYHQKGNIITINIIIISIAISRHHQCVPTLTA